MRLPILLDVDGVLADFSTHLLQTVGSRLTAADVTQWDIFALLDPEGLRAQAIEVLKDPAWWEQMPTMPGVSALIDTLLAEGAEVVCVTSPWLSCVGWESARREWIKRVWREAGATTDQVPETIVAYAKYYVRGCVLIDDKPEHVARWARVNEGDGLGLIFDAPYNRDFDETTVNARRVHGWSEATIARVIARHNREASR